MTGIPTRPQISWSRSATPSRWSSPSITHGPAMRASGWPAPTVTDPTLTGRCGGPFRWLTACPPPPPPCRGKERPEPGGIEKDPVLGKLVPAPPAAEDPPVQRREVRGLHHQDTPVPQQPPPFPA